VQDEITASVVAAIEPQLYEAENLRFRRRPPESLDAWGYVMQAMPLVWTTPTEKGAETAAHMLARAIEIDPNCAQANSLLAWIQATGAAFGWVNPSDALATALLLAQRVIDHDRWDPWGHFLAGFVHTTARRFKPAVEELHEAIACNPSFTYAHNILALAYCYAGRPDECMAELAIAKRLNPRDQNQNAIALSITGLHHLMAKRFDEAVEFESCPRFTVPRERLAHAGGRGWPRWGCGDRGIRAGRGETWPAQPFPGMGGEISSDCPRRGSDNLFGRPAEGRTQLTV